MDLKVINLKNLKRHYLNFLCLCLLIVAGSIALFDSGIQLFPGNVRVIQLKNILLGGMVAVAIGFSAYEAVQRKKLRALPSVAEKIVFYETFYRNRLWWYVFSCILSGFLLLLTWRAVFFYFCLFDLLLMLVAWPAPFRIKNEMREQELLFIK